MKKYIKVVTGAAGFIGSCLAQALIEEGTHSIVLVDDFDPKSKINNWFSKKYAQLVNRNEFAGWLSEHAKEVEVVYHLGARTDTTEFDTTILDELNTTYSKTVWNSCCEQDIPLIYASSAATYGDGSLGYDDDHQVIQQLQPLNPYGVSKNEFDKWVMEQVLTPPFWYGLKFFNVYGPNEYHKGRMASVIFHTYHQVKQTGSMKLFKSHKEGFKDGWQMRDFVYVKDVLSVIQFLDKGTAPSGIYNLGTGTARSFYDLAAATFHAMDLETNISFVDMPLDIRDKYQYFTEANMEKLRRAGYTLPFHSLEAGIEDYVKNYLISEKYF